MSKEIADTAEANAALQTVREASRKDHLPYEVGISTMLNGRRFVGPVRPARCCSIQRQSPTEPNAGILRLEPGAYHPEHYHGFAQVWYILKGDFIIDGQRCTPGSMLFHPDPHFEGEFRTDTGGSSAPAVSGRATGERPIFNGRFNMTERKGVASERVDL